MAASGDDVGEPGPMDERTPVHAASPQYGVDRFRIDPDFLSKVVRFDSRRAPVRPASVALPVITTIIGSYLGIGSHIGELPLQRGTSQTL